jgi:hypothetical protein
MQFATVSLYFYLELDMRLFELFEAKPAKKAVVKTPPPRNFVAKNAQKSGAGSHEIKSYTRKEKHKKPLDEE